YALGVLGRVRVRHFLSGDELELERRERLAEAVVNLARNAGALVFTHVLLAGREAAERTTRGAELLLRAARFGDIARNPQGSLNPARRVTQRDGMRREPAALPMQADDLELERHRLTGKHALVQVVECIAMLLRDYVAVENPTHMLDITDLDCFETRQYNDA